MIKLLFSVISYNFPRFLFLKFGELVLFLQILIRLKVNRKIITNTNRLFFPFVFASFLSMLISYYNIPEIESDMETGKSILYSYWIAPIFTFLRIVFMYISICWLGTFIYYQTEQSKNKLFRRLYYFAIFPGLLQVFRIVTGLFISIPFLERSGNGPFSGVFVSSSIQWRLMGFDFEPLGYAFVLCVVSVFYFYYTNKFPLIGLILLIWTFGLGSIIALLVAIVYVYPLKFINKKIKFYLLVITTFLAYLYLSAIVEESPWVATLSTSFSDRLATSVGSMLMFLDNPFGVGLGNWAYFFNKYNILATYFGVIDRADFQANNDLLQFFGTGGFFLGLSFLYIFLQLIRFTENKKLLMIPIVWYVVSLSAYIFFNPLSVLMISVLVGEYTQNQQIQ